MINNNECTSTQTHTHTHQPADHTVICSSRAWSVDVDGVDLTFIIYTLHNNSFIRNEIVFISNASETGTCRSFACA